MVDLLVHSGSYNADTGLPILETWHDNGDGSYARTVYTPGGGGGGGGGGGTADIQYIDGVAVPAHPTGTAIVIASGGVMADVSSDNPLPVSALALPLPTGAATDTTLAALNTVLGLVNDAIATAGGTGTASAKLRRMTQGLDELKTLIVLAAGTNVIGKVGIDQSTPGTTNLVQLPASQVTSLQTVTLTDLPPGAATESTLAALAASEAAEFALFQAGTALVNQARLTILDDTTRTVPGQAGTATLASVTASVTSVTLAAASVAVLGSSAGRMGLIVVNDSASGTLYLAYKATAAITGASAYSYKIAPGQTWEMPSPVYSGDISGIWDVASGAARVTALSA
jgi:hypothetical protein